PGESLVVLPDFHTTSPFFCNIPVFHTRPYQEDQTHCLSEASLMFPPYNRFLSTETDRLCMHSFLLLPRLSGYDLSHFPERLYPEIVYGEIDTNLPYSYIQPPADYL